MIMFSQGRKLCCLSVFLFLSLFLTETNGQGYEPASTCLRLECPQYTVVHSQNEFEIRTYKSGLWVSAPRISSNSYREAAGKGFRILRNYFKGENIPRVTINMTAPVLIDVQGTYYTVHFYVPNKYQRGPPRPTNDAIKVVRLPNRKYAAIRRFDGPINNDSIAREITALKVSLNGTTYQAAASYDEFFVAGYNRPTQVDNRVNEVVLWFD